MQAADCEAADRLASRLSLSDGVRLGLAHVWTRWDGRGNPGLDGEAIAQPASVSLVANLVEISPALVVAQRQWRWVRKRRGCRPGSSCRRRFPRHDGQTVGTAPVRIGLGGRARGRTGAAPSCPVDGHRRRGWRVRRFRRPEVPVGARALRGCGTMAEPAAHAIGLPADEIAACRRAGLVHDLGRVSVPSSV
jgi:hypothetical protein